MDWVVAGACSMPRQFPKCRMTKGAEVLGQKGCLEEPHRGK